MGFGTIKNKIYVSGKITGLSYFEASNVFQKTEDKLLAKGYEVVNPFKLAPASNTLGVNGMPSWSDHMRADIRALCLCDIIYMMNGWESSKGANIERDLAIKLDLEVQYEIEETIILIKK